MGALTEEAPLPLTISLYVDTFGCRLGAAGAVKLATAWQVVMWARVCDETCQPRSMLHTWPVSAPLAVIAGAVVDAAAAGDGVCGSCKGGAAAAAAVAAAAATAAGQTAELLAVSSSGNTNHSP